MCRPGNLVPMSNQDKAPGNTAGFNGKTEITEITYQCKFGRKDVHIRWISKEGLRPVDDQTHLRRSPTF